MWRRGRDGPDEARDRLQGHLHLHRWRLRPHGGAAAGQPGTTTTEQLVSGLSSSAVFGYSPDSANPDYVTMRLVFPAEGGDDAVTLEDGVDLRNR